MGRCNALSDGELEQKIWDEHFGAHWGPFKVYKSLKKSELPITMKKVKKIIDICKICAKLKGDSPRSEWHPLLYSEELGEVVYANMIRLVPTRRGGMKYIHCMVDNATRMSKA